MGFASHWPFLISKRPARGPTRLRPSDDVVTLVLVSQVAFLGALCPFSTSFPVVILRPQSRRPSSPLLTLCRASNSCPSHGSYQGLWLTVWSSCRAFDITPLSTHCKLSHPGCRINLPSLCCGGRRGALLTNDLLPGSLLLLRPPSPLYTQQHRSHLSSRFRSTLLHVLSIASPDSSPFLLLWGPFATPAYSFCRLGALPSGRLLLCCCALFLPPASLLLFDKPHCKFFS